MKKLLAVIPLIPFLFSGCDLSEPQCGECQDAIEHMNEKIVPQNCDPYTMENAWNDIKEKCGTLADTYVGVMAETCSKGQVAIPRCSDERLLVDMQRHKIKFHFFTSTGVPDSLGVIISFSSNDTSFDFGFEGNDSVSKLFEIYVYENEDIEIVVENAFSDVELARDTQRFTFDRQGYWSSDRGIDIRYNNTKGSYSLQFFSW